MPHICGLSEPLIGSYLCDTEKKNKNIIFYDVLSSQDLYKISKSLDPDQSLTPFCRESAGSSELRLVDPGKYQNRMSFLK